MGERISVLVADDEKIIRQGIKAMIEWEKQDFYVCGEADNGESVLEYLRKKKIDVVLLDIRMPILDGTKVIEMARKEGYEGEFIILSGYSDFNYAKTAIKYGASFYLTKPIDEDELTDALIQIRDKLYKKREKENSINNYAIKAKDVILQELLQKGYDSSINYEDFGLKSNNYQIVMYESYSPFYYVYSFADILGTCINENWFDFLKIDNKNVVLLKDEALERFNRILEHYRDGIQNRSPLDVIFLSYSPVVHNLSEIKESYELCLKMMSRRFFSSKKEHVISYEMIMNPGEECHINLDEQEASKWANIFTDKVQCFNREGIENDLQMLTRELTFSGRKAEEIRYFFIDVFINIKKNVSSIYGNIDIPLENNKVIMENFSQMYYMYEIIDYIKIQLDVILKSVNNLSNKSILEEILAYTCSNYTKNIKLETVAEIFGYNSSYLGKIFKENKGMSYRSFLDEVRVKEAARLLDETEMKVYEIASKVGYSSVDYFQIKFKKIKGVTPTEYRCEKV